MTDTHPASKDPAGNPTKLGPYRIVSRLAKGGMGVVYRGEHLDTGELVAIKTVLGISGEQLAALRREIHALRSVQHPGIVRILDDDVENGLPWVAMPLLQGPTLREHLEALWARTAAARVGAAVAAADDDTGTATLPDQPGGPPHPPTTKIPGAEAPPLRPLLTLIRRLCAPLAFLHGEGLVHRDLKPANIILQDDGRPVLVDLGIAAHGAGRREALDVQQRIGTATYMAPEQLRGELVDARADLYALGCILYECATGQPPFTGESYSSIVNQHLNDEPLPPSLHNPALSRPLEDFILKLLKKRPQDRPGYAADIAAALVAFGAEAEPGEGPQPRDYLYRPELVGRDDVLSTLNEAVKRAVCERRGGIVLVRGESGVGKTRILREMVQVAVGRQYFGLRIFAAECVALGTGAASAEAGATGPLQAFRPVLRAVADAAREGGREATRRLLGIEGKVLADYEPALLDLPGQEELPPPRSLRPEEARKRVIRCVREALRSFSEPSPLVLVLDDVQWADELSLSVLKALACPEMKQCGILIVAAYRSEETRLELEDLASTPGVTPITLPRLPLESVEKLVSGMLGMSMPPAPVLDVLAAHSNGNPFFVAEYLHAAIAEGMLRRDKRAGWRFDAPDSAAAGLSALPLPHTLADLIDRRLARLDAEAQALVAWGAVLGQELDGDMLLSGAAGGRTAAMSALDALRVRQVLEEAPGGGLRFVHAKIREIAYERIPQAERAHLHRRAAESFEARYADAPTMASTLGHHYASAGIHAKAGLYFARAAEHQWKVHANDEAIGLYQAAIHEVTQAASAEADAPALAALQEQLGDVLALIGRHEEARGAYEAALAAAPPPPHLDPARLHRKIGQTQETQHRHTEAMERYDQAENALGEILETRTEAWWDEWLKIQLDRIGVHYWRAEVESIRERVEMIRPLVDQHGTMAQRGLFFHSLTQRNIRIERYAASAETVRFAREAHDAFLALDRTREGHEVLAIQCALATILWLHDSLEEAEEQMQDALQRARTTGNSDVQVRCLTYLTVIHRRLRRVVTARDLAEKSRRASTDAQMDSYIGAARGNQAWLALERGDDAEAARLAREALALWEPLSLVYPFQWIARLPLLCVELASDNLEGAVMQAKAMLDEKQQRLPDALTAALESAVARVSGADPAGAREALEKAITEARRLGFT